MIGAGEMITLALSVGAALIAWGAHANSLKNHSKKHSEHDDKHKEHDKNIAEIWKEIAKTRSEQLEREIQSERALNNKLDDIKKSVTTDVNTAVSRMESLLTAALSSLKEK